MNTMSAQPQFTVQSTPHRFAPEPEPATAPMNIKIQVKDLTCFYGTTAAVKNVSLAIPEHRVTALIGPSGCGKSTFLRSMNRMYEMVRNARIEGEIGLNGVDIRTMELTELRRRVGMVFQKANPFPKSIFDNVAYALRLNGCRGKPLEEAVEQSLRRAALWNEVKDHLQRSAYDLSGGQQQRLSIARAMAVSPEVLLLDEPCSALDPIATARIEELLHELKKTCTIVVVTHNMQQAARCSDFTAFFLMGELIELNETRNIFGTPARKETEEYITGRFG
jgi:phosphate transport system ATP-binding protein